MPARLGTSCTASFNSACCSPVSAGGNLLTDQMTVPGDHPPQTSWSIDLWCGHPGPTPELPPSPSIPGPAAISRATSPFPVASAPDTYAVVPQPHPSATVPAASPSPSCPTATPTPISSPNNSSTANSTQRQCGFHRGFGLVIGQRCNLTARRPAVYTAARPPAMYAFAGRPRSLPHPCRSAPFGGFSDRGGVFCPIKYPSRSP